MIRKSGFFIMAIELDLSVSVQSPGDVSERELDLLLPYSQVESIGVIPLDLSPFIEPGNIFNKKSCNMLNGRTRRLKMIIYASTISPTKPVYIV